MLQIPKSYNPVMDIKQTEIVIKEIKDIFERKLAESLNLIRVSAPLFVFPETGLNDNLSGVERPVQFTVKGISEKEVEIIHSLAKWKRFALKKYDFNIDEGLYTDMNAIRRDEELDNLHSIYVDQWDWEVIISDEERNNKVLTDTVNKIYDVFLQTENYICESYPTIQKKLPDKITFISSQELEDLYPELTPKERENEICKKHGAVFLSQIGGELKSGTRHDDRAPDYDDWSLNGDILFWYPMLEKAFEVSSMGIRVDEKTLAEQLKKAGCEDRLKYEFHSDIINKRLPYTMGGGLGQSRICMFLMNKAHIGEVQAAIWPKDMIARCENAGIPLL